MARAMAYQKDTSKLVRSLSLTVRRISTDLNDMPVSSMDR
jgi:hypothetical protein